MRSGRVDSVIPLAVEGVRFEINLGQLLVGDTAALGIDSLIDSALDEQAGFGRRSTDQVHDDLMGYERLTAPVLGDERE